MKEQTIAKHIVESDLDKGDIDTLYKAIREKDRELNTRANAEALLSLRVGMKVGFGDKFAFGKRSWKEGKVVKIARTKIHVDVEGTTWTVPASMIEMLNGAKK